MAKTAKQTPTPTKEQLELAEAEGRRLGILISALDITEETRGALVSVLPYLSPQQLFEFGAVLEATYLNAATKSADQKFAAELEQIDTEYHNKVSAAASEATESLKALDQLLASKAK